MAFLFQDQNQGTRNDPADAEARLSQPFSFIRTLTVGFGITPNLLTLFPNAGRRRSRAWALSTLTAGGDFHPALRTSAARYGQPDRIMTDAAHASKRLRHRFAHVSMTKQRVSQFQAAAPNGIASRRQAGRSVRARFRAHDHLAGSIGPDGFARQNGPPAARSRKSPRLRVIAFLLRARMGLAPDIG